MCAKSEHKRKRFLSLNWLLIYALVAGTLTGWYALPSLVSTANVISELVVRLLKLLSLPMIFLSVVATIAGMQNLKELRSLGRRVLWYTVLTTVIAATLGLLLFQAIRPLRGLDLPTEQVGSSSLEGSYAQTLVNLVPSNFVGAFAENHFVGVLFMAVVLGLGVLSLGEEKRAPVTAFFSGLFSAVLKITHWLIYLMPLGVWAFVTLFVNNVHHGSAHQLRSLLLYLACVLLANFIQAFIVLPMLLKIKGLSPTRIARGMFSALAVAFFTRSSSGTLPVTLQCAQDNLGLSRRVSNFSLPLCATINMNGCAAFIIVTVLFVGGFHGVVFSGLDLLMWIGIATLAAIGNAGVAMGCYFLSGALLAAMDVPLTLLGMILPIYTFIDMVETSVNVWSDACVASIVDREISLKEEVATPETAS
jgi:Na+/H+-dicarboxylate symporter